MVDRDAITPRQPSRLIYAERPPRRRRQPPPRRRWGTAIVGLLLASGAGVYTYRQFVQPVPDAQDTAPDAARVAIPGPGFDQIASLRKISEPAETAAVVVPASRPKPQERRELTVQASLPRSPDEAVHVARPRAVVELSATPPPPPYPIQPAAETGEKLAASTLPNAEPPLVAAATPVSGELPHELSVELSSKIEAAADTPPLLAPVPGEETPAQESYARAAPVLDADTRPGEITGPDVEPTAMVRITEVEPPFSEAMSADNIPIASESEVRFDVRLVEIPEDVAGELSGATVEIEPSEALAATAGEKVDALPEQVAPLAVRPADEAPVGDAKPVEDEPGFVPAQPVPAPMASMAAPAEASSSTEYVQRFPMVVLNGTPLGAITLREFEGDQKLIHLGALLSLFRSRMDPVEYERLISAGSADQFVSLEVLRQAGLDAQYDAGRGRLIIGSHSDPFNE